jgi:hypothetical protein
MIHLLPFILVDRLVDHWIDRQIESQETSKKECYFSSVVRTKNEKNGVFQLNTVVHHKLLYLVVYQTQTVSDPLLE